MCGDKKIFIGDHILYTGTSFNLYRDPIQLSDTQLQLSDTQLRFVRVQFLTYRRQCFDVMRDIILGTILPIFGLTLSSLIGGDKTFFVQDAAHTPCTPRL